MRRLEKGGFCRILERDITARLFLSVQNAYSIHQLIKKPRVLEQLFQGPGECLTSVLTNYAITPKDKVMLAFAIARAYWQYYDSELMRARWKSDEIWFMPKTDPRGHEGSLPLCAYLTFPFSNTSGKTPDIVHGTSLTHRCPRMFDIGVLLLQVGLGRPLRKEKRQYDDAQANLNHHIATSELLVLERESWEGFDNSKPYFCRAVKFCLDDKNFILSETRQASTRPGVTVPSGSETDSDEKGGINTRKSIFYKNVVRPLEWLVKVGFKAQEEEITHVNKKPNTSPPGGTPHTSLQPEPEVLFHSAVVPKMWLRDLKRLSEQVERKRRSHEVTTPVRVAILDTGLDRSFPTLQTRSGLVECIEEEVDFVNPDAPTMTDSFGHGMFMARLIMECAPGAQILVARVAENTNKLENSKENIKKVSRGIGMCREEAHMARLHRQFSGLGNPARPTSSPCPLACQQTIERSAKPSRRCRRAAKTRSYFSPALGILRQMWRAFQRATLPSYQYSQQTVTALFSNRTRGARATVPWCSERTATTSQTRSAKSSAPHFRLFVSPDPRSPRPSWRAFALPCSRTLRSFLCSCRFRGRLRTRQSKRFRDSGRARVWRRYCSGWRMRIITSHSAGL